MTYPPNTLTKHLPCTGAMWGTGDTVVEKDKGPRAMVFAAHKVHSILLNKADVLRVQVQQHKEIPLYL